MSQTSTFKPPIDSKTASQLPRYRRNLFSPHISILDAAVNSCLSAHTYKFGCDQAANQPDHYTQDTKGRKDEINIQ